MLKSLRDFLFKDIKWKLFSLAIAFLLWFIAMNVVNPTETRTYNRTLTFKNAELLARDNVVILNESDLTATDIDIRVSASDTEHMLLNANAGNIVASIDLRAIDVAKVLESNEPIEITMDVDVDIRPLPGYVPTNQWPLDVTVRVDKAIQQSRTVQAYHVGEPAEGYELQGVYPNANTVTVSGAKSYVDQVNSVRAQINVQDAEGDIRQVESLRAYNADDVDITSTVALSETEMGITASVLPYKTVDLSVLLTNTDLPAAGYVVTDVSIEPAAINIVGAQESLDKVTALNIDGLNLGGASASVTKTVDIRQALTGLNVGLKRDQTAEAVVTVNIERLSVKEFTYPLEDISIFGYPSGASVQLTEESPVTVEVRGPESALKDLSMERFTVQLNLYGLELGEHVVPLSISLPRDLMLVNDPPQLTVVINEAGTGTADTPPVTSPVTDASEDTASDEILEAGAAAELDDIIPAASEPPADESETDLSSDSSGG